MMHHMRSPEKPAFMAGAMKPVIREVFSKKQNGPGPPLIPNVEDGEAMDRAISRKHQRLVDHAKDYAACTHGEAGGSVLELVKIPTHHRIKYHLQQQKRDKTGDGQVDEIGNLRHENQLCSGSSLAEAEHKRKHFSADVQQMRHDGFAVEHKNVPAITIPKMLLNALFKELLWLESS